MPEAQRAAVYAFIGQKKSARSPRAGTPPESTLGARKIAANASPRAPPRSAVRPVVPRPCTVAILGPEKERAPVRGLLDREITGGRLVLCARGVLEELAVREDDVVVEVRRLEVGGYARDCAVFASGQDRVVLRVGSGALVEVPRRPAVHEGQNANVGRRDLNVKASSQGAERRRRCGDTRGPHHWDGRRRRVV